METPVQILSALAAISAFLTIRAEYMGPRRNVYLFKPLTVLLIILIAFQTKTAASQVYRLAVIVGLLFSLVGDVFLMLPRDRFIQGLISFLLAHLCYIFAFSFESRPRIFLPVLTPLLLYGILMLRLLWPNLKSLRAPVVIYMLVILLMGYAALSRYLAGEEPGSLAASVGALLFIASDSALALDRFKSHFRSARALVLLSYFLSQWLIALST